MTKGEFVSKYYLMAKEASQRYPFDPLIMLAQSAHETGWGGSYSARVRKNMFGLTKGGSNAQTPHWGGKWSVSSVSGLKFRVYDNPADCFYDFAYWIHNFRSYTEARKYTKDIYAYSISISNSRYISEENGDDREAYKNALVANYQAIKQIVGTNEPTEQTEPPKPQTINPLLPILPIALGIAIAYATK